MIEYNVPDYMPSSPLPPSWITTSALALTSISVQCHVQGPLLTGKDTRPSRLIGFATVAINVDEDTRVAGAVSAWERHQIRGRLAAGAARDAELRARQVELRAASGRGRVQRHVLDAEQVLAVGEARWDGEADLGFACDLSFSVSCWSLLSTAFSTRLDLNYV
jgi:hypothetical protein